MADMRRIKMHFNLSILFLLLLRPPSFPFLSDIRVHVEETRRTTVFCIQETAPQTQYNVRRDLIDRDSRNTQSRNFSESTSVSR